MSYISDYKCGALTDNDYRWLSARENARERAYIDEWERVELEYENDIDDEEREVEE